MQNINSLLKNPTRPAKKKRASERGDLMDFFLANLNPERVKGGYKPLTPGYLSFKLSGLKLPDLYYMRSVFLDIEKRNGRVAAIKNFYWSIRNNENTSDA